MSDTALEPVPWTPAAQAAPTILCVDDEPNILSSLRRLFRGSGYQVRVAESGAVGLQILQDEPIDIVISDMRMPEMNGAQFLQQACQRWPHTARLLLTGQADMKLIADAINEGEISRYITKPWDDDEVLQIVRDALQRQTLEREKRRVAEIATIRNEELRALNSSLEHNVNASHEELSAANARLKNSFVVTLKVFSSLIEMRHERLAGHSRRVADLARKLATRLKLESALVQEVFVAALLHEVGKLGFSDELLNTPVASMNAHQLQQYRQHAGRAEQLLMPLQDLRGAAASIGAQLERFDGAGFPNHLKSREILVGARILSVCSDYDNLQIGVLARRNLTAAQAQLVITGASAKRYDPWVVEAFVDIVGAATPLADLSELEQRHDTRTTSGALAEGVVLSRDLLTPSGLLMLSAGHPLDARLIQKMRDFEKSIGHELEIYVKSEPQ